MQSRILKGLYHFTVYTIGVCVLVAAIIVSLIRLALPDIGIYRNEIEAWVSNYMGYPMVIQSIDATWQGWIPELYLTDIDLLNKAGTEAITHFDSARVRIAPLATLMERQFIPKSLIISGFDLSIALLSNGAIYIEGVKLEGIEEIDAENNELAEWFFKQDEIKLQNANIEWVDVKNQQDPISLTNVSVELRNDVGRFQVEGSADLPAEYGHQLNFAFDAFGDLLTSDWSGELYLSGKDISPDNWYTLYRPKAYNIEGGIADIKVWSNWQEGQLTRFEGDLEYDNFYATSGKKKLHIQELAYSFNGQRKNDQDWTFDVKFKKFQTENGLWPGTDISFDLVSTHDKEKFRYIASFSYLKLDDLNALLSDFSIFPESIRDRIKDISFNGELKNGNILFDPDEDPMHQLTFDASFDHLSTSFNNDLPSFSELTGKIQGTLTSGTISLHDNSANIYIPSIGVEKVELTGIDGKASWERDNSGWNLKTDIIEIKTPDFISILSGSISKKIEDSTPFLDIVVDVGHVNLEKLTAYLPLTDRFKLRNWMERAIVGGEMESASTLFRGYLKDFPFDENNGRFQFIADISNGALDYAKQWPPADLINAEILIEGRQMRANINSGKFFGADVSNTVASLEDILKKKKTLKLAGNVQGEIKDLGLFIDQSPMQNNLSLYEVRKILTAGEFDLDLDLAIPLRRAGETRQVKTDVKGNIKFIKTVIDSPIMKIQLNDINGNISFAENAVSSEILHATYLGHPVSMTVNGNSKDAENPVIITLNGEGDETFLIDHLLERVPAALPLEDYLRQHTSGESAWQVSVSYLQEEGQTSLNKTLEINSSLQGMEFDLPEPLSKNKDERTDIKIKTQLVENGTSDVDISFGEDFKAHLEIDKEAIPTLQLAQIRIGDETEEIGSKHSFPVRGKLNHVSVEEWTNIIKIITAETKESHPLMNGLDIDLQVANIDLFGRKFSNVRTFISKHDDRILIKLDGDTIKGDISLPNKMDRDHLITLQMEKLYFNNKEGDGAESKIDPATIPALVINVEDFRYLEREMGALQLTSSAIANGLSIEQFQFNKEALHINGNGEWTNIAGDETSSFIINLEADHMDAMLKAFGYGESPIKDGKTTMNIAANWSGSPGDFSMEKLNGNLGMNIKKGQFLDINPSAGRLFGLLSIQTLPRRLLLDFSDVFGKGLSFDNIEGSFDISRGNAYTNNLYMTGPAAEIAVSGRTGLVDKDYDQVVTVTPQISGSLPVASALFGPVGIGVGAVIYLFNSINNKIDNLLKYQYTITGSWEEPVIEKIKKKDAVAGS